MKTKCMVPVEVLIEPYWNWNSVVSHCFLIQIGLNRTLLELKLQRSGTLSSFTCVLIEPYWNWNKIKNHVSRNAFGLNRTLLELKPIAVSAANVVLFVLIEPYWNWNGSSLHLPQPLTPVLIEPYWNWNCSICVMWTLLKSLNRTLLELKHNRFY